MKIGIISLYFKNHNYGGLLQCYALTNYLKQLGFEAEQVTYDRFVSRPIGKKIQSVEFAKIPQKMIVLAGMQEKLEQKSKRFLKLVCKRHRVSPVDLKN